MTFMALPRPYPENPVNRFPSEQPKLINTTPGQMRSLSLAEIINRATSAHPHADTFRDPYAVQNSVVGAKSQWPTVESTHP